ncbi:MAG: lipopolysaccharide transport periplasmic protein LptA [Gammaproteobacteria bacterium]|nr:lipopolysaccharide transport periplasmic protein LptA [Gammaproteobacteria bacterium]MDH5511934.1 lipopolysaccharide transport periplasmic protein LptA [Gammaproteobacteria bacterium]
MKLRAFRSHIVCCLLASLLAAFTASAADRNEDEPIRINARSVEANEKTGTVIYSGDVVAEQGRLSIRADRVEIHTRQGKTVLVRATGRPVKLRQGEGDGGEELRAEAGRLDYHVSQKKIDMIGQVTLRRGDDLFTADALHYDLVSRSLNAAGDEKNNGRVHAVIRPAKPEAELSPRP